MLFSFYVVNFDPSHRQVIVDVRGMYFSGEMPAGTLIGVQALAAPDLLIELEVIAAIERQSKEAHP
jgi:enamine deaminase RidA (YjgF/YER057c/UK114 family)